MTGLAANVKARMRRRRHARRARRKIRGSKTMNRFLRLTLGPWLARRYRVRTENLELVKRLRPPYLVLANHMCVWDPFFVNNFVPEVIHYVVSDANFRSKLVEFGLGLVGSIPKTKVMSDLETVKNIMKVKEAGGIVGIFPEGQNTWDGHTMPM
ncbi:MAG: lysophospholipid acyltransferase family protein, partial [bacterium]